MNYPSDLPKGSLIFRVAVSHALMWPWVISWNWSPTDNRQWIRIRIKKGTAYAILLRNHMKNTDKRMLHSGLVVDILWDEAGETLSKRAAHAEISLAKQIHAAFIETSEKLLILLKHIGKSDLSG